MSRIKVWKVKAYKATKVDYVKSQSQIGKLLEQNGVSEKQFTDSLEEKKCQIVFLKPLDFEGRRIKIGVKVSVQNITEKTRNQIYRALFYYLKAKFESLSFGFVEEYNEAFVKEFMPYLIADKQGKTIADLILPNYATALENAKEGSTLYLEEPKEGETK